MDMLLRLELSDLLVDLHAGLDMHVDVEGDVLLPHPVRTRTLELGLLDAPDSGHPLLLVHEDVVAHDRLRRAVVVLVPGPRCDRLLGQDDPVRLLRNVLHLLRMTDVSGTSTGRADGHVGYV